MEGRTPTVTNRPFCSAIWATRPPTWATQLVMDSKSRLRRCTLPCMSATRTPVEEGAMHDISRAALNMSGGLCRSCASLTGVRSKKVNWRHYRLSSAVHNMMIMTGNTHCRNSHIVSVRRKGKGFPRPQPRLKTGVLLALHPHGFPRFTQVVHTRKHNSLATDAVSPQRTGSQAHVAVHGWRFGRRLPHLRFAGKGRQVYVCHVRSLVLHADSSTAAEEWRKDARNPYAAQIAKESLH